ncbi:uncharacterized protein LOC142765608 isoform X2 [Rhipicephalus microplus]|uniref:uncharacterized protein LOC142765608 isoform X2 n=1 Tax=Rhipicephalus microplus TaxID=6941 RepID=UPI003F6CDF04
MCDELETCSKFAPRVFSWSSKLSSCVFTRGSECACRPATLRTIFQTLASSVYKIMPGLFTDLPPQEGQKSIIPPPPPDENDGPEDRVWESEVSEATGHGGQRGLPMKTGQSRQIRGRRRNMAGQTPRAAGKMRPPLHAAETTEARDQHVRRVGIIDTVLVFLAVNAFLSNKGRKGLLLLIAQKEEN